MNISTYLPNLLNALILTIILLVVSLGVGLFLSILMTTIRYANFFLSRKVIEIFIFFICGTPLLVQLFLVYYGSGQVALIRYSFLWQFFRDPLFCAIFTFAINTACYTSVILWGAIHSVPKNEVDAGYALGMNKWLVFRRIILPRALRIMLPAYSNEVVMVLKNTSLASTITILELMGMVQLLIAQTYNPLLFYCIAGFLYLLINVVITHIFRKLINFSNFSTSI